jgi:hypothetical protein
VRVGIVDGKERRHIWTESKLKIERFSGALDVDSNVAAHPWTESEKRRTTQVTVEFGLKTRAVVKRDPEEGMSWA